MVVCLHVFGPSRRRRLGLSVCHRLRQSRPLCKRRFTEHSRDGRDVGAFGQPVRRRSPGFCRFPGQSWAKRERILYYGLPAQGGFTLFGVSLQQKVRFLSKRASMSGFLRFVLFAFVVGSMAGCGRSHYVIEGAEQAYLLTNMHLDSRGNVSSVMHTTQPNGTLLPVCTPVRIDRVNSREIRSPRTPMAFAIATSDTAAPGRPSNSIWRVTSAANARTFRASPRRTRPASPRVRSTRA